MKKLNNKKYKIIFSNMYIQQMKQIKENYEKNYYIKLKNLSNKQLSYLENMPRMYQKIMFDEKLNR